MTYGKRPIYFGRAFAPEQGPRLTDVLTGWDFERHAHALFVGRPASGKTLLAQVAAAQWAMSGRPVVGWFEDEHYARANSGVATEATIRELVTAAYGEGLSSPVLIIVDGWYSAPVSLQETVRELVQAVGITGARFHLLVTDHGKQGMERDPILRGAFSTTVHLRPARDYLASQLPGAHLAVADQPGYTAVVETRFSEELTYITLEGAGKLYTALNFHA